MKEYICKICDKQYSSIQSLCNHNKKFHTKKITPDVSNSVSNSVSNLANSVNKSEQCVNNKYLCKHCAKGFNRRQSRWTHENKFCKLRNVITDPSDTKQNNVIKESCNNTKSNTIINNGIIKNKTINNGTINNGTINNITINNYKNDNLDYISDKFIKRIFNYLKNDNDFHMPIPAVIENIKFNPNHKENNNVKITNMRSNVGLKYNDNKWLTVDKDELLNELYIMGMSMLSMWSKKDNFLSDEMKKYYERFNKISKFVLEPNIKKEINKKAYIYTKNNDNILDT